MPEFDYRTNRFWSMIDSIKRYVAETGHKVSSHDDAKTRTIGFISTENAPARMLDGSGFYGWRITISELQKSLMPAMDPERRLVVFRQYLMVSKDRVQLAQMLSDGTAPSHMPP
jgi:hypothetical protein